MTLELLQDRVEAGACHEAFSADRIVAVPDLAATDAWPEYSARATSLGFGSVLGVPMHAKGQTIGVLNVYRERSGPWSQVDVEAAEILTAIAAAYVLHADELRAQHTLSEQLHQALQSRDVIGQAKGILMARHEVDADAAFDLLRKRSQSVNRKLRDIAQELVDADG